MSTADLLAPNPDTASGVFFGHDVTLGEDGARFRFRTRCLTAGWRGFQMPAKERLLLARFAWRHVSRPSACLIRQFVPFPLAGAYSGDWTDWQAVRYLDFVESCPAAYGLANLRRSEVVDVTHAPAHTHPDTLTIHPLPWLPMDQWFRACLAYYRLNQRERRVVQSAVLMAEPGCVASAADEWVWAFHRHVALSFMGKPSALDGLLYASEEDEAPVRGCDYAHPLALLL